MYNPYAAGYGPQAMMQGMQTMNNLGDQISSGYALANLLSSANMQSRYGPESDLQQEYLRQQGQTTRLQSILPVLLQSFGGGGGAGGFTTNYGASASYGSGGQAPQNSRADEAHQQVLDAQRYWQTMQQQQPQRPQASPGQTRY
jgi:hypothetical protein